MKRKTRQAAMLTAVALAFLLFNAALFTLGTWRCLPSADRGLRAKAIELDRYLPFDDDSEIVKVTGQLALSGELPVIDSASALYPVTSAFVHALYPESAVEFDGSDFAKDSRLQMRNTAGAYRAVVDGDSDIVVCAAPSEQQLQYADQQGVELKLVPIGREAFVFLTSSSNPVTSLTLQQIRGIYAGDYTFWSQLGGPHTPILPLQRAEGSGSQSAFLSFMEGQPTKKNYLGFLGAAIGFSFRFYVEDVVANGNVRMLAVDGVYPDLEGVTSGGYPLVSEFYAVYDAANDNPNIPLLIDWFLSEQGQDIIEQTGYLPLA